MWACGSSSWAACPLARAGRAASGGGCPAVAGLGVVLVGVGLPRCDFWACSAGGWGIRPGLVGDPAGSGGGLRWPASGVAGWSGRVPPPRRAAPPPRGRAPPAGAGLGLGGVGRLRFGAGIRIDSGRVRLGRLGRSGVVAFAFAPGAGDLAAGCSFGFADIGRAEVVGGDVAFVPAVLHGTSCAGAGVFGFVFAEGGSLGVSYCY